MLLNTIYGRQPIVEIDVRENLGKLEPFGLVRNRNPNDAGWGEWSWVHLDEKNLVIIDIESATNGEELIGTLYEDLASQYGARSDKFYTKLLEFNLVKNFGHKKYNDTMAYLVEEKIKLAKLKILRK